MSRPDVAGLVRLVGLPLSDEQLAAVTAPLANGLVEATAGSGKTTVMAARVVWLVWTGQTRPDQVLGLTFTRKAAAELRRRVARALGEAGLAGDDGTGEPVVSTYDAFAAALVAEAGLGGTGAGRLLDDAARFQLAGETVRAAAGPLTLLSRLTPSHIARHLLELDTALSANLVPVAALRERGNRFLEELATVPLNRSRQVYVWVTNAQAAALERAELAGLVEDYRRRKREAGVAEFADHMAQAIDLIRRDPALRAAVAARHPVVLLDEYQDTSAAQGILLRELFAPLAEESVVSRAADAVGVEAGLATASARGEPLAEEAARSGCVTLAVGDPFQAIYGWRGASASNLADFARDFGRGDRSVERFGLTTNRRSDRVVIAVANAVAAPLRRPADNGTRVVRPAEAAAPGVVETAGFLTWDEEVAHVADEIAGLRLGGAEPAWRDVAVLARRNADLATIWRALADRDVPAEIVGVGGLIRLPDIAGLIAHLKLANDPGANPELVRLLLGPRWGFGHQELARLGRRAVGLARAKSATGPGAAGGSVGPAGESRGGIGALGAGVSVGLENVGTVGRDGGGSAVAGPAESHDVEVGGAEPGGQHGEELGGGSPGRPREVAGAEPGGQHGEERGGAGPVARDGGSTTPAPADLQRILDGGLAPSLADAVADPGPGWPQAVARGLARLAADLAKLRQERDQPVGEILDRVISLTGLDAELAAQPDPGGAVRRRQVADFRDAVAQYAAGQRQAGLTGLLAWLDAEAEFGLGLDQAGVSPENSVKLLTVHRAKGLEWDNVFLPSLVDGVFPSSRGPDNPLTRAAALPHELRADRAALPALTELSRAGATAFAEALAEQDRRAEDRLAYVAVTRARHRLVATTHCWRAQAAKPKAPSPYFLAAEEVAAATGGAGPRPCDPGDANPIEPVTGGVDWPPSVDDQQADARREAAQVVEALRRSSSGARDQLRQALAVAPAEVAAQVAGWERACARVVAVEPPRPIEVTVPATLTVSQALWALRAPSEFAAQLARPWPRPPSPAARVGQAFHQWRQDEVNRPGLWDDWDDDPGDEDLVDDREDWDDWDDWHDTGVDGEGGRRVWDGRGTNRGDGRGRRPSGDSTGRTPGAGPGRERAALEELRRAFRDGRFAGLTPVAVEWSFTLALGGLHLRGRIDAVFDRDDPRAAAVVPEGARYLVVDWKTGQHRPDPTQLSVYRLAWATAAGVDAAAVAAGFYLVGPDRLDLVADPLDEAALAEALAGLGGPRV